MEDALCDRGDDLDAPVEEAEAVEVGAQVVGRAGDHKARTNLPTKAIGVTSP